MDKKDNLKKSFYQRFIDFIAKVLFIKRKKKEKPEKKSADDIYTIW